MRRPQEGKNNAVGLITNGLQPPVRRLQEGKINAVGFTTVFACHVGVRCHRSVRGGYAAPPPQAAWAGLSACSPATRPYGLTRPVVMLRRLSVVTMPPRPPPKPLREGRPPRTRPRWVTTSGGVESKGVRLHLVQPDAFYYAAYLAAGSCCRRQDRPHARR